MTGTTRQGFGLALLGLVLLLVGYALGDQAGNLIRGIGGGLVLVGLIAAAVGLLKTPQRD
jgi:hypothetical protein